MLELVLVPVLVLVLVLALVLVLVLTLVLVLELELPGRRKWRRAIPRSSHAHLAITTHSFGLRWPS